jgi:enoyl-CoA hydratase/carnithine racemase
MSSNDSQQQMNGPASCSVAHRDHGNGIFSIQIEDIESGNALSGDLIGRLLETLETVRSIASVKVLMLNGTAGCFLRGKRAYYNESVVRELYQSVASFPYPVIAVMQGIPTHSPVCFPRPRRSAFWSGDSVGLARRSSCTG